MDDNIWFVFLSALFIVLGIIFVILGLAIWKKQKMELIIRYHCDKVKEKNKPAYCALSGIGIFVIGMGFILSGILTAFIQSALSLIPMAAGLAAGMVLLISAGIQYNR